MKRPGRCILVGVECDRAVTVRPSPDLQHLLQLVEDQDTFVHAGETPLRNSPGRLSLGFLLGHVPSARHPNLVQKDFQKVREGDALRDLSESETVIHDEDPRHVALALQVHIVAACRAKGS